MLILSIASLTFPSQAVEATNSSQNLTFSNASPAADALGIGRVGTTGDFKISSDTCRSSLPASGHCTIVVEFKPTATGTHNGSFTIDNFNPNYPHIVSLTKRVAKSAH
jgi:hypothetical protein